MQDDVAARSTSTKPISGTDAGNKVRSARARTGEWRSRRGRDTPVNNQILALRDGGGIEIYDVGILGSDLKVARPPAIFARG